MSKITDYLAVITNPELRDAKLLPITFQLYGPIDVHQSIWHLFLTNLNGIAANELNSNGAIGFKIKSAPANLELSMENIGFRNKM